MSGTPIGPPGGATRGFILQVVTLLAGACATSSPDPFDCEAPPSSPRELVIDASSLAGLFHLTLVADDSGESGSSAEGILELRAAPEQLATMTDREGREMPNVATPLLGTLQIDLATVGASAAGDTESTDPEAPGVLVIEDTSGRESVPPASNVILRLGSGGNDRRTTAFDGPYAVLFVQRVDGDDAQGFSGFWRSGDVQGERAAGHFCALRTTR